MCALPPVCTRTHRRGDREPCGCNSPGWAQGVGGAGDLIFRWKGWLGLMEEVTSEHSAEGLGC